MVLGLYADFSGTLYGPRRNRYDTSTTDLSHQSEREIKEAEVARRLAKQQHPRVLQRWMEVSAGEVQGKGCDLGVTVQRGLLMMEVGWRLSRRGLEGWI